MGITRVENKRFYPGLDTPGSEAVAQQKNHHISNDKAVISLRRAMRLNTGFDRQQHYLKTTKEITEKFNKTTHIVMPTPKLHKT